MPKIAITAATIEALGAATGGTAALACAGAARRPIPGRPTTISVDPSRGWDR
jgi:hypothetical protein